MQVTDERLRTACDRLGLNPLGTIEAELPSHLQLTEEQKEEGDCLENDDCHSFVTSGDWVPEAGPLGFALGHPSPGWAWLRDLVDQVGGALADGQCTGTGPEARDEFFKEQSHLRAAQLAWDEALIAVADIGVNENSIDSAEYVTSSMETRTKFTEVAFDLLDWIGFRVCREVFTQSDNSKETQR